jgi:adenosine deaminase
MHDAPTAPPRLDEHVIRRLPKAEVHIHLEGTFSLLEVLQLSHENGRELPRPARTLFDPGTHIGAAAGLGGFLRFLDWQCSLVRTREQASRVAYAAAARQTSSGTRYTDMIVNPTHWRSWHGRELELIDALAAGFDEAEQDGLCSVSISYSLLRAQGGNEAEDIVESLVAARPRRVVALSIDGDEAASRRTGTKFARAFRLAADAGLHRTVHAGESSGPEGVWDAVDLLGAERIDHGVRSIEDPRLIDHLVGNSISLGVCPRSNIALGLYPDWSSHPLTALLEAGVAVTLNTDDPAPLGATLEGDWAVAARELGFGFDDMAGFARRSIDASFAPDEFKRSLRAELGAVVAEIHDEMAA